MRKITIAAIMLVAIGRAGAQQSQPAGVPGKAASSAAAELPAVIPPSAQNAAAETVPGAQSEQAEAGGKPAATMVLSAQDLPDLESMEAKPAETERPAAVLSKARETAPAPAAAVQDNPAQAVTPPAPDKAAAVKAGPAAPGKVIKPAAVKKKAAVPTPIPPPEPAAGGGFSVTKTHKVVKGDTLWDLSNKYYSDPFKWGKIYNANLGVVANPDLINPQEELVIPEITEAVKPQAEKTFVIGGGDTVKDADLYSSEVFHAAGDSAAPAASASVPAPAAPVKAAAGLSDVLDAFERDELSEDMPEDQKEWTSGVSVVPAGWREDGVISAKKKNGGYGMDESLSVAGETVQVSMSRPGMVKTGDRLAVYMKGASAYDKDGKKIGREIQPAGTLEVLAAEGNDATALVLDSVTSITKGYVVKKK